MTIGQKLRKLRKYRGLSQEQIADKLGMKREQISRIENSKKRHTNPTINMLLRFCNFYGITLSSFFKDVEV